jgi:O-antigen ligase
VRTAVVIRRLLSILPCAALLVVLGSPGTSLLARLLIVSIFGVTLWNPAAGLLAAAGLAPLGAFLAALDGIVLFRLTEVILLSFIAAWLVRTKDQGPRTDQGPGTKDRGPALPRYAWAAAWLFSVLLASLSFALSRQLLRYPDVLRINLETIAIHYFGYGDPTGISDIAMILEGFALVAAVMELFRWRPALARSLPVVLALSAIVAAATSVLLSFGIGPQQVLAREAAIGYRFAAHVIDLNAAGSHFAMILCLALGIAIRERGGWRGFWIAAAGACAAGLWMSRSRSAEAAAGLVVPLAFLWATSTAWTRAKRLSIIGGVLAALLIFGAVRAWQIERDPTYRASGFRQQFVMSSFRVIGTHPYLGIGPGRYYRDSPNFLTPQLAWSYGSENAHNYFLQVTTEAGIIGFFVYAAFFAGALSQAFSALSRRSEAKADWRLLGATAGVIAFLGTCLTGHPLLVREVAAAFFIQLALAASLGGSAMLNDVRSVRLQPDVTYGRSRPPQGGHYVRIATFLGTIAFAVLPAWTLEKPMVPVHLEEVDGMYYGDEGTAEGRPFHWTRQIASFFVPATARTVDVPLRSPIAALTKEPTLVEITSGGKTLSNALVDDKWSTVRLTLPSPEPPLLFSRINLRVNHTAKVADLLPGSSDQRVVGVQLGDYEIVRVAWEFVPKPAGAPESTP